VRLQGDRLVGPDPRTGQAQSTLVAGLSRQEQILFAQGLNHPYYWAGMILTGSPW
jgi:CHAT domain-containing protein